jgi:hypothetical protein
MKDMNGREFTEGCRFIRPYTYGHSAMLEERVARIRNGKLYGDFSKVAIQCPERCYILDQQ